MADDFDRFAFNREATDWEEFTSLGALDDAPPPNPRFVRALRGELMNQAASMSNTTMVRGQLTSTAGSLSAPLPMPNLARPRFDRRLKFELAAVAILLLSLIGSISLYDNNGTGNTNNILNGLATQSTNTDDQPFALYQGDAARTGISPEEGPIAVPEVVWRQQMTNPDLAPALAVDGVIYLVDAEGGEIQAVSATTGRPFWGATVGRMAAPSIAVANGFVYVVTQGPESWGGDPGYLIALKQNDGKEQWRYEYGGSSYSAPAVDHGLVYVVANNGMLRVVNAMTGVEEWQLDFSGAGTIAEQASPEASASGGFISDFSPVVSNGLVYATANDGILYAIGADSHQVEWTFKSEGNVLSTAAVRDGQLFLPATWVQDPMEAPNTSTPTDNGWVYALSAETGAINWTWEAGRRTSIYAAASDRVFVQREGGGIAAIDPDTGEPISGIDLAPFNSPVTTSSMLYVSSGGSVYAYQYEESYQDAFLIWSAYVGEGYLSPVLVNDMIVTRGPNGTLLALGQGTASPAATQDNGDATPTSIDVSGFPTCQPPEGIDWQNATGDPARSFVPVSEAQQYGQPADLGFSGLPTGNPAPRDTQAGILLTLHDIENCNLFGNTADLSGFFSEDFFKRVWVQIILLHNPGYSPLNFLPQGSESQPALNFDDAQLLEDGRVAAFFQINPGFGYLIIFTDQDGYWVIDETIQVTQNPGGRG
ncbi:hypothetical protein BH09CHL1_BH09CHL1_21030 [soil metagenome]